MITRFFGNVYRRTVHNFWWKLGSLTVAIVIWSVISVHGYPDKTLVNIPYELRNLPLALEVVDRGIGVLQVTAKGPQNLIAILKPENISIPIDIPDNVNPGEVKLPLSREDVITPYPNQISIFAGITSGNHSKTRRNLNKTGLGHSRYNRKSSKGI